MGLADLAKECGFDVLPTAWVQAWNSEPQLCEPDLSASLSTGAWLEKLHATLNIPDDLRGDLYRNLPLIAEEQPLGRLLRVCHYLLYVAEDSAGVRGWPTLDDQRVPDGNMIWVYLFLSGYPFIRRRHAARGIDESVTCETYQDLFVWMRDHRAKTGHSGVTALRWISNYLWKTDLVQLGRLQFGYETFKFPFVGYQHRIEPKAIVFVSGDQHLRSDGQFDGANRLLDPAGAWVSTLRQTSSTIEGHCVSPHGIVDRSVTTLPAEEWKLVFQQNSRSLFVHIPAGKNLAPPAVSDSIQQALDFFPRHFPDKPFDIIWSHSWLLDGQFQKYLPEHSNIVAFQRQFHLFPVPNVSDRQTMERVFGNERADLGRVRPANRLQEAILEHARRAGHWRCQGGVIFPKIYHRTVISERKLEGI